MSQQLPSKLLRFRDSTGKQVFYPASTLRGIQRNSNDMEFYFNPLVNSVGDQSTDGKSDKVTILFSGGGDVMWTAIINFYNKLHTTKGLVYTVADADASGTTTEGYFFGFGSSDSNVNVSNLTNTVTIEVAS